MDLFIEIVNGHPVGHPYFGDNLRECFGNSIPEKYVPFQRVEQPFKGDPYVDVSGPVYQWDNGVVKDVWTVRHFTPEERQAKIDAVKAMGKPFESWVFDEAMCCFVPPVPNPNDGAMYIWDEGAVNWVHPSPVENPPVSPTE